MPLLSITARFTSDNTCKVQLSGGSIPTARMRLKMYAVHLKHAVGVSGGLIPTYCLVSLDGILGNTQIHNALPHLNQSNDLYEQNSHLTLPLSGLHTVQECSVGVQVNKHIPKQLEVKVFKYNEADFKVVPFPVTAAVNTVTIEHVQLWFEYANPNLF